MAAKKMFPPGEVEELLGRVYDEFKLDISFRIQTGQVIMQFSDSVERVRMTSGGARKLATMLIEKAAELDRLGITPTSVRRPARRKPTFGKSISK